MRIIFAGTPDFAAYSLSALLDAGHDIICVYTQPDRKTGRGQKLTPPAVKKVALEHNIDVRQPNSLKEEQEFQVLQKLQPNLIIVVAYGMILPQRILDIPTLACINIHASLLPRWRGAAPIQRAIQAGDLETGVGIMKMEAGLDTGPILFEAKLDIEKTDTSASLHDKLAELGAQSLLLSLESIERLLDKPQAQNHDQASYAHKITKFESEIDWTKSVAQIHQDIRAFNPWPISQSSCNQQRLRIWQANIIELHSDSKTVTVQQAGTIIAIDKHGIQVSCGKGVLNIQVLQRDGSKPLPVKEFINSTSLQPGDCFQINASAEKSS